MQASEDEPVFPCKLCGRKFIKSSLERHVSACKKLSKLNRKPFDSGKQRATGSDITYADVKKAQKEKDKVGKEATVPRKHKVGGQYPRPQTNWKQRHEHFIDAVSSSKKVDYAIKTGAPLPPPPKTAIPNDYPVPEWSEKDPDNTRAEEKELETEEETDDLNRTIHQWMNKNEQINQYKKEENNTEFQYNQPPTIQKQEQVSDYVQCEYCGRNFNARAAERHIPFCREQHKTTQRTVKPTTKSSIPATKPPTDRVTNRDSSPSRMETRGRVETRSSSREDLTTRRRSLDSRAALSTSKSTRTNTQSANHTRPNGLPQAPPKTRSSSAPKNNSRLKTPVSHMKKLNLRT